MSKLGLQASRTVETYPAKFAGIDVFVRERCCLGLSFHFFSRFFKSPFRCAAVARSVAVPCTVEIKVQASNRSRLLREGDDAALGRGVARVAAKPARRLYGRGVDDAGVPRRSALGSGGVARPPQKWRVLGLVSRSIGGGRGPFDAPHIVNTTSADRCDPIR